MLAGIFLAGTSFVLFNDLIFDGAKPTTGHVLTALALIAATAAGHQIVTAWRAGRYGLTLGLAILTAASLAYVATMSGARNAEQAAHKAERIDGSNQARAEILAERRRAQDMLDKARAAIADECKSGEGSKCRGRRATAEVYSAAVAGHDARLVALPAPQTPNAGYRAAAEAIVMLPWFSDRRQADVERALIVLLPWLAVLIAELGTIVFLSAALGHSHVPTLVEAPERHSHVRTLAVSDMTFADVPAYEQSRQLSAPQHMSASVLKLLPATHVGKRSEIVATLEAAGRQMTVGELAHAMHVTPSEASRRWREAGRQVTSRRDGKYVVIGLPQWNLRAVG